MVRLTRHAIEAVEARGIARAWPEDAIASPTGRRRNPPGRTRSHKAIAAFGGRIPRVVHRPDGADILVITAHFDRDAKP